MLLFLHPTFYMLENIMLLFFSNTLKQDKVKQLPCLTINIVNSNVNDLVISSKYECKLVYGAENDTSKAKAEPNLPVTIHGYTKNHKVPIKKFAMNNQNSSKQLENTNKSINHHQSTSKDRKGRYANHWSMYIENRKMKVPKSKQ